MKRKDIIIGFIWALFGIILISSFTLAIRNKLEPPKEPAIIKADLQAVKDAGYAEVARLETQCRSLEKRVEALEIRKPVEISHCDCPAQLCDCYDCPRLDLELIKDFHPKYRQKEFQ